MLAMMPPVAARSGGRLLNTNTLQWQPQLRKGDVIQAPFADVRVATIDPADVGAVAVAALTSGAHDGRTYRLSGPESLLLADRVATLAEVLGRDLRFEAQPDDEARTEMAKTTPPEYVDAFFRFFADGELDESPVLPTVEDITGRPLRTFAQWAGANAHRFNSGWKRARACSSTRASSHPQSG